MTTFEHGLILLLVVTALGVVARRVPWPLPITYVLGGLACAFVPRLGQLELDPDFFFLCFLPPLLFVDGWLMPLREFLREKVEIVLLATGLVALTTVGVGFAAHWLVPGLPLAMAFALGAVVSPTDAVAVNAITERLSVPMRLRTVLNGESLMNDATGLVAFKFALAAVAAGSFSAWAVLPTFLLLALGGLAAGLGVAFAIGRVRDVMRRSGDADPFSETTLSLLTPFAAYLVANGLQLSGIMGVVAAGLYSGWRDPVRMEAETRQMTFSVWRTFTFWLNGGVFVLLGLQIPRLFAAVRDDYTVTQLVGFTLAVTAVAMLLRLLWFFPSAWLTSNSACRERPAGCAWWHPVAVGGWAGMRGAVTLAAALSIPHTLPTGEPFPGRGIVIFLSGGVVIVTLLVQGTTLEGLIRRLGLRDDGWRSREERLARSAAVEAGLKALRRIEPAAVSAEAAAALGQVIAEYEHRLAELGTAGETQQSAHRRRAAQREYRVAALTAEREAIDALWSRNAIGDDVHRPLQQLLDYEERLLKAPAVGAEE